MAGADRQTDKASNLGDCVVTGAVRQSDKASNLGGCVVMGAATPTGRRSSAPATVCLYTMAGVATAAAAFTLAAPRPVRDSDLFSSRLTVFFCGWAKVHSPGGRRW